MAFFNGKEYVEEIWIPKYSAVVKGYGKTKEDAMRDARAKKKVFTVSLTKNKTYARMDLAGHIDTL